MALSLRRWRPLANAMTAGARGHVTLLLTLLLWQRVPASVASSCVSDVCFCFADGDIECADIYLRRVPRFTRYR